MSSARLQRVDMLVRCEVSNELLEGLLPLLRAALDAAPTGRAPPPRLLRRRAQLLGSAATGSTGPSAAASPT
jgi:hypothetical protein